LPKADISPEGLAEVSYPSSFSILSHVPYIPSERDQGYCGNCWVWGCTAPVEVANDIQNGVRDRLSIQYLNSKSWACCGGWELVFEDFYNIQGKIIPWSNSNASFQDSRRHCSDGTSVPAGSISTDPNYPITSIQWHEIRTNGVSTTQAIKNIKSYLYGNKALTLGFYLPDFTPFRDFWGSNSGNWDPDSYCGLPDGADPGGHEVTVVGWDDSTDSWIVLNSWGVDSAHPDGTYKLKMDMNYSCANSGNFSYSFGYFDVVFGKTNLPPDAPSTPSGPSSGKRIQTTYKYTTYAKDQYGDEVKWV
jgi:serine protease